MEYSFTDRQLDVMNILWSEGSATVREARRQIDDDLAYTSVLTIFQTLEENCHVRHESEGKAYRYFPTVSRKEAGDAAVTYVLNRIFDGAIAALLRALAKQESLSPATRQSLRQLHEEQFR